MSEELWQFESRRPVEWLAVFLAKFGYIPYIFIVERSPCFAPAWIPKQFKMVDPTLGKTPRELGKICPECGNLYPATPAFWHRNARGRHGLYSLCKFCVQDRKRDLYWSRKFSPLS